MTDHSPSQQSGLNLAHSVATAEKTPAFPTGLPRKQGLYDPRNEHDACGVGFVAHMKGQKSHQIVRDGLFMLENLTHRGAVGADPLMGDGAGILVQIPDRLPGQAFVARVSEAHPGRTSPEPLPRVRPPA